MAKIIKYALRAVENKAWLLLGYLAIAIASHLVLPQEANRAATTAMRFWWLISWLMAIYTLPDIVVIKGAEGMGLLYQQTPQKTIYTLLCHYLVAFGCVALYLTAYASFAGFGASLMPGGFSTLVALNILSFSLYATALGLALMSFLAVLVVGKERRPKLVAVVGALLIAYLLAFHAGPGVIALGELVFPLIVTGGLGISAGGSLLHTPQAQVFQHMAQVTAMLVLQGTLLAYFFSGKVDIA